MWTISNPIGSNVADWPTYTIFCMSKSVLAFLMADVGTNVCLDRLSFNKYVQWGFALTQTSLIVELQVLDKIRFF